MPVPRKWLANSSLLPNSAPYPTGSQHLNRPDGANPGTLGPHFTVGGRIAWNINLFVAYKRAAINRSASWARQLCYSTKQ
ncbi:hypothetical protein HPB52_008702 [Rhipicephalus sanguineus]|uniref:Uncharacterized protein n=1 Tax=Rhipicephalus sanguineus TaxID=34632 RepID=A0A9D4PV95_RHISA|nr:hypothetical protein HPB52_008702 [Rhipicephalus sanguineus]